MAVQTTQWNIHGDKQLRDLFKALSQAGRVSLSHKSTLTQLQMEYALARLTQAS
jgi:hypothetical protein